MHWKGRLEVRVQMTVTTLAARTNILRIELMFLRTSNRHGVMVAGEGHGLGLGMRATLLALRATTPILAAAVSNPVGTMVVPLAASKTPSLAPGTTPVVARRRMLSPVAAANKVVSQQTHEAILEQRSTPTTMSHSLKPCPSPSTTTSATLILTPRVQARVGHPYQGQATPDCTRHVSHHP